MTKQYFQPEVQVAQIALQSIILAGSGAEPAGPSIKVETSKSTNEVW